MFINTTPINPKSLNLRVENIVASINPKPINPNLENIVVFIPTIKVLPRK